MTKFMSVWCSVAFHLFCGRYQSMCTIFTLYDNTTCQAVLGYKYKVMNGACGTEGKNNVALLQTYLNNTFIGETYAICRYCLFDTVLATALQSVQ